MLVVQTVSSGFGFYNMSVYMVELAKILHLAVADISIAVSLFFVSGGIAGLLVARLLGILSVRLIMIVSALGCAFCLWLVGMATQLWQVYLLFTLFGVANTGVSLVVATTLITWWFPGPNRSIALSISSTGLSIGGILITPISAHLFNTVGLSASMPWLAVCFFVLIAPIALFVVKLPAANLGKQVVTASDEDSYRRAIRSSFFILLALGYIFCMGAQVGGIAHLYAMVEEISGYRSAASAVQVLTICSITGRFLGGWIVTKVSTRWFTLVNVGIQMLGLFIISQADSDAVAMFGAACFGISVGNLLMLQPLWLADAFAGPIYPRVFALANALSVCGVALGPYLIGVLYDMSGYDTAYMAAAGVSFVAWFIIYSAGSGPNKADDELAEKETFAQ